MLGECRSFLQNFLRDPQATGAVAPATPKLADSVAAAAQAAFARHAPAVAPAVPGGLQVIELGAGTGALTHGIRRLQPVLVERDEAWAALLRRRFPGLEVRQECATETLRGLQQPVGLVTSIPLLNNPQSGELKHLIAQRYADGLIRFCVLYTYGLRSPLPPGAFREARRASFVPRSLPPAHVWVYQ